MTGDAGQVFRVEWLPGTDHLLGICFCRAEHVDQDPVAIWDWLQGHPAGHQVLAESSASDPLTEVPA